MNTDLENWIESNFREYEFFESIKWIKEKYPKVYDKFIKNFEEHYRECKFDPYYNYCYGAGKVPVPCCEYCEEYDKHEETCIRHKEERDSSELCEHYEWNGEWEED